MILRATIVAALVTGCTATGDEVSPPVDQLFFPSGLALAPGAVAGDPEPAMFVVNSNSELRYDTGTITSIDVAVADALIDEWLASVGGRRVRYEPFAYEALREGNRLAFGSTDVPHYDLAAAKYTELKMFDVNGGVTAENLDYTARFFGPDGTGTVKKVYALDEWTDLSFLEAALNELGTQ